MSDEQERREDDCASVVFLELERARNFGDTKTVERCLSRLASLGFWVQVRGFRGAQNGGAA